GLGLVLLALHQLVYVLVPYEYAPGLRMLLGSISEQPVLCVLLAGFLTWAAHSSVAIVLVIMAFAAQNILPPQMAFALVLGANLGAAANPLLEGARGADPASRRLPLGNFIARLAIAVIVLPLLPYIASGMVSIDSHESHAVADFHTIFNLAT